MISPQRRHEILYALRQGAVPSKGLAQLAVGLKPEFVQAIDDELVHVGTGCGSFKAIRGNYGTGKTFTVRWIEERARDLGFATTEVQISETETPLHKLNTVYRRAMERLQTESTEPGAFQDIIDVWAYRLEQDALSADPGLSGHRLETQIADLMEKRLANVTRQAPQFAAAIRGYQEALVEGDHQTAQGLIAWLAGQPHIAQGVKKKAGLKGDIDHFGALSFLEGLLTVLRDSGHKGLVMVLDEVETLQRVRSDAREKSLNALRQLIDEVDGGRFPGLYIIITGTPAFFDGPQGVQRSEALAQRLATHFDKNPKFDNPRNVQVRLPGFGRAELEELGHKVRDIFADGNQAADRILRQIDDAYIAGFVDAVLGNFGGRVNIAPRVFLKKLVDVMDRVELYADYDPRKDYDLQILESDLTPEERALIDGGQQSVDDIELDLSGSDD